MNRDKTLNLAITPLWLGLKLSSRIPESVKILYIFLDNPQPWARLKISDFQIFDIFSLQTGESTELINKF